MPLVTPRSQVKQTTTEQLTYSAKLVKYSKTCLKRSLSKRPKFGFQDQLSLNAGQKYCRMLQGEHSALLSTCIKLPFAIKTFVLSLFEWPLRQVLLYCKSRNFSRVFFSLFDLILYVPVINFSVILGWVFLG